MKTGRRGLVYSTEVGRTCPKCGWPANTCRCSTEVDQPLPDRIIARLRIEKAGRRGKTVTVVESLPRNAKFLKELTTELKRACATGGKCIDDRIEIQGDHRERLRELLKAKGWVVRG